MKGTSLFFLGLAVLLGACAGASGVLPLQADIMVANMGPVPLGELDAGVVRLFSAKVDAVRVAATYHPRTDAVTLELRPGAQYRQFWSRRMRRAFLEALSRYEADYSARNLPLGNADRTGRVYGAAKGRLEWRMTGVTREFLGFPVFELGYRFENENPYFTITQRITKDERDPDVNGRVSSGRLVLYFTRAMARELAAIFDEEHLHQLVPEPGEGEAAPPQGQEGRFPEESYNEEDPR